MSALTDEEIFEIAFNTKNNNPKGFANEDAAWTNNFARSVIEANNLKVLKDLKPAFYTSARIKEVLEQCEEAIAVNALADRGISLNELEAFTINACLVEVRKIKEQIL